MEKSIDERQFRNLLKRLSSEHIEDIRHLPNPAWPMRVMCEIETCYNISEYTLTLAEEWRRYDMSVRGFSEAFKVVYLCADHIPDNVKALPVFKLAKFKERARGSGQ